MSDGLYNAKWMLPLDYSSAVVQGISRDSFTLYVRGNVSGFFEGGGPAFGMGALAHAGDLAVAAAVGVGWRHANSKHHPHYL